MVPDNKENRDTHQALQHYIYDASGERVLKASSDGSYFYCVHTKGFPRYRANPFAWFLLNYMVPPLPRESFRVVPDNLYGS